MLKNVRSCQEFDYPKSILLQNTQIWLKNIKSCLNFDDFVYVYLRFSIPKIIKILTICDIFEPDLIVLKQNTFRIIKTFTISDILKIIFKTLLSSIKFLMEFFDTIVPPLNTSWYALVLSTFSIPKLIKFLTIFVLRQTNLWVF